MRFYSEGRKNRDGINKFLYTIWTRDDSLSNLGAYESRSGIIIMRCVHLAQPKYLSHRGILRNGAGDGRSKSRWAERNGSCLWGVVWRNESRRAKRNGSGLGGDDWHTESRSQTCHRDRGRGLGHVLEDVLWPWAGARADGPWGAAKAA